MSDLHGDEQPLEAPPWLPAAAIEESVDPRTWWRRQCAAINALSVRYPRALEHLPDDWWAEPVIAEQVMALAVWRLMIDSGATAPHPSTELEFHRELDRMRDRLDGAYRAALGRRRNDPDFRVDPAEARGAIQRRDCILEDALESVGDFADDARAAYCDPHAGRPRRLPAASQIADPMCSGDVGDP